MLQKHSVPNKSGSCALIIHQRILKKKCIMVSTKNIKDSGFQH